MESTRHVIIARDMAYASRWMNENLGMSMARVVLITPQSKGYQVAGIRIYALHHTGDRKAYPSKEAETALRMAIRKQGATWEQLRNESARLVAERKALED